MWNSWWFWYGEMRDPDTKLYCDKINLRQQLTCNKKWIQSSANWNGYSSASVGFGLVMLAVGVELGFISSTIAAAEAVEVIELMNMFWARGEGQFLKHWGKPDYSNPNYKVAPFIGIQETSTIDTAIVALGAYLAGKYFQMEHGIRDVKAAAKNFIKSVDWAMAIVPRGVLREPEKKNSVSISFNEYYMVAYIALKDHGRNVRSIASSWEANWQPANKNLRRPPGAFPTIHLNATWRGKKLDIPLLGSRFPMSSFVPQFPAFLCKDYAKNSFWQKVVGDYMDADMWWWRTQLLPAGSPDVFGSGPGQSPDNIYSVDKIYKKNPSETWSAAIMAGFLVSEASHKGDVGEQRKKINEMLEWLWKNQGRYGGAPMMTRTRKKILWRSSAVNPKWRPNLIVMDYVNFPLGYATNFIGPDFYKKYAL